MHGAWRVSKVLCRDNDMKKCGYQGSGREVENSIGT